MLYSGRVLARLVDMTPILDSPYDLFADELVPNRGRIYFGSNSKMIQELGKHVTTKSFPAV
jgi:hypothetical protein